MSWPGDRAGWSTPTGAPAQPTAVCSRCARVQPPLPRGVRTCVFCSAPLPLQRWRATPPPGVVLDRPAPPVMRPYFGPPSYGDRPPRWGFPPVVWRAAPPAGPGEPEPPARALTQAAALCLITAVVALLAAGAELWRYLLLLQGRTVVLSGAVVRTSDRLVGTAGWVVTALAVVTAAVLAPLLVRLHAVAARRAGLAPSRVPAAVLARLVVPGWNLLGVGVVAGEIDGQLSRPQSGRPRLSPLVVALWIAWVVDSVLVLITLLAAFGTSDQAVADTVELHIFVDLAGAVVAALFVLLLRRWRRRLGAPRPTAATRWVVRPPLPTRGFPVTEREESSVGSPS
jgi:hypothetical protein